MFQNIWFIIRGFANFLLAFLSNDSRSSRKPKFLAGDKADVFTHVWLNVNITMKALKFTDISKGHVNKY
jgi:hypothetical protein